MDFDFIAKWGWVGAILLNALTGWVGWSLRTKFVTRDELTALLHAQAETWAKALAERDTKLAGALSQIANLERDMSNRVTRLEGDVKGMPSHADLARINLRLEQIADATSRMDGALTAVQRLTDLLTEAQMERERAR